MMWRMLSKLCLLWVNCRRLTMATCSHESRQDLMQPWNAIWVSSTAAAARHRRHLSSSRTAIPRCSPAWRSLSIGKNRKCPQKIEGIFFCWKKDAFPWGSPPSGLGAKCLSAVLLDNQDRALRHRFLIFTYSADFHLPKSLFLVSA